MPMRRASIAVIGIFLLASCGVGEAAQGNSLTLRLGYFPNVTHATAIVGVENGIFAQALGSEPPSSRTPSTPAPRQPRHSSRTRSTPPSSVPTRRSTRSPNQMARRSASSSGATSGGAFLVVKDGINSAADLRGQEDRHAAARQHPGRRSPLLAGRPGLRDRHARVAATSLSCRRRTPTTLHAFQAGQIDGAWVPEPWATRLSKAGGHVLVDERDLWPDGKYVTTHLIVTHRVPGGPPRRRQEAARGSGGGHRLRRTTAPGGAGGRHRRRSRSDRQQLLAAR